MTKILGLLVTVALLVATGAGAATDPFAGQWMLDVHRSSYPAGTCPKRMTIEMESVGGGIRYVSNATYANGNIARSTYTADYNGRQAIVMGTHSLLLPVFLKRIDSHTVVATYTKALQVVATSRRVVSRDGRLMTIRTTSKDEFGKAVTTVGVYDRDYRGAIDILPFREGRMSNSR